MPTKWVRRLGAGLLAVTISLPIGARPAQAVDVVTIVNTAVAAYKAWNEAQGGKKALAEAVAQIIASINSAKTAILTQVDRLAAADAKACARHAVVELADIDTFDEATLRAWAQDVTGCVTLIDALAETVTTQAVIDDLGFTLNTVGPIALAARARAGFSTEALTGVLVSGNQTVITRYDPACVRTVVTVVPLKAFYYTWTCTASNGEFGKTSLYVDRANGFPYYEPDLVPVKAQAARNTSEPLAATVLPLLAA